MQERQRPDERTPENQRGTGDSAERPRSGSVPEQVAAPETAPATPQAPTTRASDADRDTVLSILNAAMANGRLDQTEHDTRSSAALSARTLGELAPLTEDLPEAEAHAREVRREEKRRKALKHRAGEWRSWLGAALIMNVIWAVSSISSGELTSYWPVYPLGIWGALLLSSTFRPHHEPRRHPPR